MKPEGEKAGFVTRGFFFCIVAILAAWGGYLRFFALETQGFWIDEGFSVVHALSILKEGYPLLPSGEVSWSGSGAHYPMALGLSLFEEVHRGARFFSAFAGTLLLAVFYVMNVRLFRSRFQALTAVLLLALMSYEIAWSRQARFYVYLQFYSVASLAALYGYMTRGRKDRLLLAFLLAGAAALTHRAGLTTVLIVLLTFPFRVKGAEDAGKKPGGPLLTATGAVTALLVAAALFSWPGLPGTLSSLRQPSGQNYLFDYGGFLAFQFGKVLFWAPVGIFVALWKRPRTALPLVFTMACYLYIIGLRTTLFHFRYLLPVLPFLAAFAAFGFTSLMKRLLSLKSLIAAAAAVALPALFFLSVLSGQFQLFPKGGYVLGYTAPQPEWRAAYRWIVGRGGGGKPATLSTFPMWHDIYLGDRGGEKYFLPFSLSGLSRHFRETPQYSRAVVVREADELKEVVGFAVFDDFSLAMVDNAAVRSRLLERAAAAVFESPEGYQVSVWKLPIK